MKRVSMMLAVVGGMTAAALAQPTITSLGTNIASTVNNNGGGVYQAAGGATVWTLNGSTLSISGISGVTNGGGRMSADGVYSTVTVLNSPQISGNTATAVSPPFSTTPTLVPSLIAATESNAARYNTTTNTLQVLGGLPVVPELMVYGSGSSGSSSGTFNTPHNISSTGRFIVGQGYISTYNSATGATISANTFQWRPWIWDAQANAGAGGFTILPTPFRTSSNTWRRRTGIAMDVSTDGLVIVGAQEHNVSTTPTADPDGARLVVWRWNAGTSAYEMSYLPNGVNGSGFPHIGSITAGTVHMNDAGTMIIGPGFLDDGTGIIAKWTWDGANWSSPVSLGSALTTTASWLPFSVTSCNVPPRLSISGASEDGSIVVGTATYSTCGSFMAGGWIYEAGDGTITDWYDHMVASGAAGITAYYGPIGDNGDPARGLPRLGFPSGISRDGNAIVGFQGGNQLIPGAPPWIVVNSGGPTCVAPVITTNPSSMLYSRCSSGSVLSQIIQNVGAAGTLPISYQWFRNGSPLADGTTASGSSVTGAASFQLRVTNAGPADSGTYTATATGCNSVPVTTLPSTVQNDPAAVTPANDTCATAQAVGEGTFTFNMCGAYANEGSASCVTGTEFGDVWYVYTPTFTGEARFQTCASGFDTTLQLSSGCNGALFDCSDDVGTRGLVGTTCSSTRSLISRFPVVANQPVYVRVGARGTPTATGSLTISQAPPLPANDQCSSPTSVGLGTHAFNLAEATEDFNYGTDFCSSDTATSSNRDVWFLLDAPCGGTVTIDTCGSAMTNPMLHVLDNCGATPFNCDDNVGSGVSGCSSNQARISNLVITGPVLIRVSNSGTGVPTGNGIGQLVITGTLTTCCGSSDFDGDGDAGTDADIEAFFACLGGSCCATCGSADFDGDGDVGTDADIEAFFRVLGGGTC